MPIYSTMEDLISVVRETLGVYADDYDASAIAHEISDYQNGKLVADFDRDDYWDIVFKHDITAYQTDCATSKTFTIQHNESGDYIAYDIPQQAVPSALLSYFMGTDVPKYIAACNLAADFNDDFLWTDSAKAFAEFLDLTIIVNDQDYDHWAK